MPLLASSKVYRNFKPLSGNNAPRWFTSLMTSSASSSGIRVNEDTAISLSTVFNAITIISESLGQIPISVYRTEGEKRVQIKDHRSYRLIAKRPNKYMTAFTFNKVMMNHLTRFDDAYAVIERDGFGRAVSMTPIHPKRVQIRLDENENIMYEVDSEFLISAINMIHFIGYTEDGITGKQRINILKDTLGNSIAAENFTGQFFSKGVNVSGFIKTKNYLKDQAAVTRLKESFAKSVTGGKNAFGVGVLEDGSEWIPNEIDPSKADLNATRRINGQTVAQIWNIPLPILKIIDSGMSYANAEQIDIQLVKYTLMPYCVNIQQEYEYKLLTEQEKREGNIYFKHNLNALMRGDMSSRGKFYESLTKTGAYSPNRILELEDENGYEGGDIHVIPSGYQTVEQLNKDNNGKD